MTRTAWSPNEVAFGVYARLVFAGFGAVVAAIAGSLDATLDARTAVTLLLAGLVVATLTAWRARALLAQMDGTAEAGPVARPLGELQPVSCSR